MLGMNDVTRALYTAEPPTSEILENAPPLSPPTRKSSRPRCHPPNRRRAHHAHNAVDLRPNGRTRRTGSDRRQRRPRYLRLRSFKNFAAETGAAVVDFHGAMTRLNADLQRADPAFTLIGPDRIHPAAPGHFVMAYTFLKAQGAPDEVASLILDARTATVTHAGNGRATAVRATPAGGLTFTWAEDALPFPLVPAVAPALAWVPFNADFNRELSPLAVSSPGPTRFASTGPRSAP